MSNLYEKISNLKQFTSKAIKEDEIWQLEKYISSIVLDFGNEALTISEKDILFFNIFETTIDFNNGFIYFKSEKTKTLSIYDYIKSIIVNLSDDTTEIYDIAWSSPIRKISDDNDYILLFSVIKKS